MTQESWTLVTMLETYRATGVSRATDVPVQVSRRPRGKTIVHIGFIGFGNDVVLTLTEAERIALIEALGGQA